jgi:starch-binding outer membrane protein, SusD/RagB family
MKNFIVKINLFAILLLLLSACNEDILDKYPLDRYSDPVVWSDIDLASTYLNRAYQQVEFGFNKGEMLGAMTDELVMARGGANRPWNMGTITADNLGTNRGQLNWGHYANIQRINLFISKIGGIENNYPEAEKASIKNRADRLLGEAIFLRAWVYHNMMRSYGGLVLLDKPSELGDDFLSIGRSSFKETIDFLVKDCDDAALLLGLKSEMEMGRATKEAAMALKSRILIFAASDLTAGPNVANDLVGYTNPNRTALWTAARDAAKAVIDLGTVSLDNFGAPDQDAVKMKYHEFFEATDLSSNEIIWGRMFRQGVGQTVSNNQTCGPNGLNQYGRNGPMQQMVDSYQMMDGSDFFDHFMLNQNQQYINISSTFTYENPYYYRDPRFYASMLYDSAVWQPRFADLEHIDPVGIYDRRTRRVIENGIVVYERFGLDTRQGPVHDWNGNWGGYILKKFMKRGIIRDQHNDNNWIFMRYPEILLNYAEACIELEEIEEAADYINMVRTRAGMPEFTGDIWDAYHYERKIELFAEDIRWYDIRRWRKLEELLPKTVWGISILQLTEGGVTTTTWSQVRAMPDNNFVEKMYWIPIESAELRRAPQLCRIQATNWISIKEYTARFPGSLFFPVFKPERTEVVSKLR